MPQEAPIPVPIPDRIAAGQILATRLSTYARRPDAIVLALPRGGVPVAYQIAEALGLHLDLLLVRKLGVPGHSELAMGAIASGGVRVMNRDVLAYAGVDQARIEAVAAREGAELQRRAQVYRGRRPLPPLRDRQVILVDDGVATGATMQAAVQAVRQQGPARIVIAVPVAAPESAAQLRTQVDELICPCEPPLLMAIGHWYVDFGQTSDDEVIELLQRAWQREDAAEP
ncbi:phosphoribosyltransferase [Pseudomonas lalucatii]|uniref:Phosphoribosyltransferase n=1 Tax=Pseudomonas lalucatii TaxID=1424203 RepID=A0ABS5PVV3_9PSED|nr:phosphoribosyltransferase [Pseudomonas lalucatii]MBS7660650.1 phosphoribosyltransferase [Pseudomonas lalucatii]MBS7691353.1 phosphoribosyltransferase [Pseudomonas lalucatii]MBS7724528.1 phosphoribosyltransferase [Pseudomonas lalucatii]